MTDENRFLVGLEYDLSPADADKLCSEGFVFVRRDGEYGEPVEHNKGSPNPRTYRYIGRW